MITYQSEFQKIEFLEDKSMLQKAWAATTEDMTPEQFKSEVQEIAKAVEMHKPNRMLDNTTEFNFPISTDLQSWVDNEVFPRFIAAGLKMYAIIVSSDLIAQLSIKQTMEEGAGQNFLVHYFDKEDKALEWLMK